MFCALRTLWDAFQFSTADAGLPRVAAVAGCPTKAFAARPETLLEARRARDVVVGSETAAMASSPSLNAKDMLASVYDEAEVAAKAYALEFMRYSLMVKEKRVFQHFGDNCGTLMS